MRPPGVTLRGDGSRSPSSPEPIGDKEARLESFDILRRSAAADVHRALADLHIPGREDRTATIGALARALGGSIEGLGYPVGMGQAPSADDCLFAAARILDRLLACISDGAVEIEAARNASPLGHSENTPDQDQRP